MKRRARNRRQNRTNNLDFQRLEPKQLLAGDLLGAHQAAGFIPTGANVVVNGDFETFTDGPDRFFDESEVAGWNARDAATGQEINIMTWNVAGYDNVLDIDSTSTDYDRVFQDVATESSSEYLISFDYRNHPTFDADATAFTHDFEVWWNGSLAGRFTGGDHWHSSVIRVTSSDVDTTELLFSEIQETGSSTGDGRGALIDNVRVVKFDDTGLDHGGFEVTTRDPTSDRPAIFFSPEEVEGWSAITDDGSQPLLQLDESEGLRYLNLDTTGENRDMVYRNLDTVADASYLVTFDMRNDGEQSLSRRDQLRVRWGNEWAGTLFGTNQWETYGLFLTAESTQTNLMFLEPGEFKGDGSGPLLDNVNVFMVGDAPLTIDANGDETGLDGSIVFIPGTGTQEIAPELTFSNPSNSELTSVAVTLNGVSDGADEVLSIDELSIPLNGSGTPKIAVTTYDSTTNILALTGAASAQEYEAVLQTLTYGNTAANVSTDGRLVNIEVIYNGIPTGRVAEAAIDLSVETNQRTIDAAKINKYIIDNGLNATDLGNGLFAVIDAPGTGLSPTINSTVRVQYNGKFIELNDENKMVEGESFDSSSGEGYTTLLTNVIQGWGIGIPAFKTGGFGQLLIPSHLGYGSVARNSIPANSVLVFDVELLEILN